MLMNVKVTLLKLRDQIHGKFLSKVGKEKVGIEVRASLFPEFWILNEKCCQKGNRTVRQKILSAHNGIMFYEKAIYYTLKIYLRNLVNIIDSNLMIKLQD